MRDFAGTPGTLTGLALRLLQCVFAAGSIAAMTTTTRFFNFTAFCAYSVELKTLPHCFDGFANHLELWTNTVGCICLGEKEDPPQHSHAHPFCRWRLGDGNTVSCGRFSFSRNHSALLL
ncbi:hypothetical protein OIU76_011177 [Salix suchowensis]|nr:hypothetical protein OIU76_011177 [Salix suchowensis]